VRERIEAVIAKRFGDRTTRPIQLAVARSVTLAGISPDTFYRKLKGDRPIMASDLHRFAKAFGENPQWLATGEGLHGAEWIRRHFDTVAQKRDGRPPIPLTDDDGVVAVGWVASPIRSRDPLTGKPRRGRPRKRRLGYRVTGKPEKATRQKPAGLPQLKRRAAHLRSTRPPKALKRLNAWVSAELDQAQEPRRDVLEFLLSIAEPLETATDERTRQDAAALTNELRAVLKNLGS
jgi:hypothetical protein